jgi:hypothetical protein
MERVSRCWPPGTASVGADGPCLIFLNSNTHVDSRLRSGKRTNCVVLHTVELSTTKGWRTTARLSSPLEKLENGREKNYKWHRWWNMYRRGKPQTKI